MNIRQDEHTELHDFGTRIPLTHRNSGYDYFQEMKAWCDNCNIKYNYQLRSTDVIFFFETKKQAFLFSLLFN